MPDPDQITIGYWAGSGPSLYIHFAIERWLDLLYITIFFNFVSDNDKEWEKIRGMGEKLADRI